MAESAVISRLNWDKGNRIYNKGNRFIMPYTEKLDLQDYSYIKSHILSVALTKDTLNFI